MSDTNKPGFKDIGDLRSRLGLSPTKGSGPGLPSDDEATRVVPSLTEGTAAGPAEASAADVAPPVPTEGVEAVRQEREPTTPYASPSLAAISSVGPPSVTHAADGIPFSTDFSMPDPGDATMAAFAPVARSARKVLIGAVALATVMALFFGYMVGQTNKDRLIINKRIRDCQRVAKALKRNMAVVKPMVQAITRTDPGRINWELGGKLTGYEGKFPVEETITDNMLFGPSLTMDLITYSYLANQLHEQGRRHGKLTTKKHRKHLEEFSKVNAAAQSNKPIFVQVANGRGTLLTVEGEPRQKGRDQVVPARTLAGTLREVSVSDLVALDRRDVMAASGPSVMELYADRMRELQRISTQLDKIMDGLMLKMQREADRPEILAI